MGSKIWFSFSNRNLRFPHDVLEYMEIISRNSRILTLMLSLKIRKNPGKEVGKSVVLVKAYCSFQEKHSHDMVDMAGSSECLDWNWTSITMRVSFAAQEISDRKIILVECRKFQNSEQKLRKQNEYFVRITRTSSALWRDNEKLRIPEREL